MITGVWVPQRWTRRPVRHPALWWSFGAIELLLGLWFAFGGVMTAFGSVLFGGVAAFGVGLAVLRAIYEGRRYATLRDSNQ